MTCPAHGDLSLAMSAQGLFRERRDVPGGRRQHLQAEVLTATAHGSRMATTSGAAGPESTLTANAAAFLTRLAHRTADSKASADLFATHSWYVAPPPPPPAPPAPPAPPPVPVAPPLPFTFLGSYAAEGDKPTYFLSRGDRIYDVKVGDSLDSEYSLDASEGSNLIFTYKPLKARQSLLAGGAQ